MEFEFPVHISEHTTAFLRELNHKQFKILVKAVLSEDPKTINRTINNLLTTNCQLCNRATGAESTHKTPVGLNVFEKLAILLNFRIISIDHEATVNWFDPHKKENFERTLDLSALCSEIEKQIQTDAFTVHEVLRLTGKHPYQGNGVSRREMQLGTVQWRMSASIPTEIFYSKYSEKLYQFLVTEEVYFDENWEDQRRRGSWNNTQGTGKFSMHSFEKVIDPANYGKLLTFLNAFESKVPKIELPPFRRVGTDKPLPDITIGVSDASMMNFIKMIFNYNLTDLYEIEYTLINKFGYSLNDINEMTPRELQIHLQIAKKDQDEQRAQDTAKSGVDLAFPPVSQ